MTTRDVPTNGRPQHASRVVPERRPTAALLLAAGIGVFATVFAALPAPLLTGVAGVWCATVVWFALTGTSTAGFTTIASLVKLGTLALIAWAIIDGASPIGIRSGLDWIPLGTLNMGTGLWFLQLIRHRAR